MAKNNELMVQENFEIAVSGEVAQLIADELDGETISFDRIKIPSGGGLAFEVPSEDPDNPNIEKEIVGIVIYNHPINAYWESKYDGQNTPPSCSSLDGKTGINTETGELHNCKACPFNQFGSDGEGKACKNMYRLYIALDGEPFPFLLTLPPTSLTAWSNYKGKSVGRVMAKTKGKIRGVHHVFTKITLKKAANNNGIAYSTAQFAIAGTASDENLNTLTKIKEDYQKITRRIGVIEDEYGANSENKTSQAVTVGDDEFADITDTEPSFEEAPTSADE